MVFVWSKTSQWREDITLADRHTDKQLKFMARILDKFASRIIYCTNFVCTCNHSRSLGRQERHTMVVLKLFISGTTFARVG